MKERLCYPMLIVACLLYYYVEQVFLNMLFPIILLLSITTVILIEFLLYIERSENKENILKR